MFISPTAHTRAQRPGAGFSDPDDPLITMADPALDSRIVVINPGALDLACTLLRRGYQTASVVRLDDRIPAHQADIVIIPTPATAVFLQQAIPFARRMLAPMGAVALRLAAGRPDSLASDARQLLLLNGFTAIRVTTAHGETLIGAELPLHGHLPSMPSVTTAHTRVAQTRVAQTRVARQ